MFEIMTAFIGFHLRMLNLCLNLGKIEFEFEVTFLRV